MNTKQIAAAAALALMGSVAFAQGEADLQHVGTNQTSTVNRAEVRADVQRALAAGDLYVTGEVLASAIPAQAPGVAVASRAQVRADVMSARADLALPGEAALQAVPTSHASALTREEVRAEARAYVRSDALRARIAAGY
jgi:hypothetical protein